MSPNRPARAAPVAGRRRLATAVSLGVAAALLAACHSGPGTTPTQSPSSTASGSTPTSVAPGPTVSVTQGPRPPATGAWLGAWVKPAKAGQMGRVDAVSEFEQAIGRALDLVHVYHPWSDPFPDAADRAFLDQGKQLMISWAGTDTSQILAGTYDDLIRQRATAMKELGKPVMLRWRWEMNRPNLDKTIGSPQDYVAAWKHIRSIFQQVGATNVGWVWCPLAGNFTATNGAAYYPGDDQVDWLCTDVYAIGSDRSFGEVAADFMTWAASHPRPVVIGEYGSDKTDPTVRSAWIAGAAQYAREHPQIKAMVYFDADHMDDHGVNRNFRVEQDAQSLAAYTAMAKDPWFTASGGG